VSQDEAQKLANVGISHRCRDSRHAHFTAARVQGMVARGELWWVGRHSKIAAWADHMSWAKVYRRNRFGEVIHAGMQMIHGLQ
jgi:hypothetical protein